MNRLGWPRDIAFEIIDLNMPIPRKFKLDDKSYLNYICPNQDKIWAKSTRTEIQVKNEDNLKSVKSVYSLDPDTWNLIFQSLQHARVNLVEQIFVYLSIC